MNRNEMLTIQPCIDLAQIDECVRKQCGHAQQQERKANLSGQQQAGPLTGSPAMRRGRIRSRFHVIGKIVSSDPPCGQQAKASQSNKQKSTAKGKCFPSNVQVQRDGWPTTRRPLQEKGAGGATDDKSENSSDDCQQQIFNQQLP